MYISVFGIILWIFMKDFVMKVENHMNIYGTFCMDSNVKYDCDFDSWCSIPGSEDYDVKSPVIEEGRKVTLLDWLAIQKRA